MFGYRLNHDLALGFIWVSGALSSLSESGRTQTCGSLGVNVCPAG